MHPLMEMMVVFERAHQGGGGNFLVGQECMRRMKDLLLVNEMSRDEQHLAELFILGRERSGITRTGVPRTGVRAKGHKMTGGGALGVKKGPHHNPVRCNVCSWFQQKEIMQGRACKGQKCPDAVKEARKEMTAAQLRLAVIKLLREAAPEGQTSTSKGLEKK